MCEIDPLKKAKYTIRQYTEDEKLRMIAEAREEQQRNEKSAMSFWKKEGYREGFKEGLEEGCREGLKESLSKGIDKGRKEGLKEDIDKGIKADLDKGRNETMYSVILAMKKNGLDAEQIARLTGFNADDVRASYGTVK